MKKKPKARKPLIGSKRMASSKANTSLTENPSKWIRISRPFALPKYVRRALQRLDEAGHVAYIVGGSVRDFLLQRQAKDYDIATSAGPEELSRLFPEAVTVGKAFGVFKIPLHQEDWEGAAHPDFLEIATFREDLEYEDFRRPTGVVFSGPAEDARRRDFTINALFYDPKSGRILDVVDGMADLKNKVVRAIGKPSVRFREDALRLLRAVRFSTRFGFTLETKTEEAIREKARLISHVSAERIRDELTMMWVGPSPSESLRMLSDLGLLKNTLPELEALKGVEQSSLYHPEGDVWRHTLKALDRLEQQNPQRSLVLAWAVLLHDVGKPTAGVRSEGKNFNGHEKDGAKIAAQVGERLKMSRDEIDRIVWLVENHLKFKDAFKMRESTLLRFVGHPDFEELLALHRADATASNGNLAYYEFCASRFAELQKTPDPSMKLKLLTGEDLIQLGLQPGPKFSEILRTIEDLTLEKKLQTKEEALEYVVQHFVH